MTRVRASDDQAYRRSPVIRSVVLGLSFAVLLISCGGAGNQNTSDSLSPLDALWSYGGTPSERARTMDSLELERQTLVAGCMAKLGFDYQPIKPEVANARTSDFFVTGEDRVDQYGFGVATVYEEASLLQDELVAATAASNQASSDSRAFDAALYGSENDPGCDREGFDETFGEFFADALELGDERHELEQRVAADPAVIELDQRWRECVNEKGIAALDARSLQGAIRSELMTLETALLTDSLTEAEFESELATLQQTELQYARVDYDCEEPLRQRRLEIRVEYETAFINDHGLAAP